MPANNNLYNPYRYQLTKIWVSKIANLEWSITVGVSKGICPTSVFLLLKLLAVLLGFFPFFKYYVTGNNFSIGIFQPT